MSNLSSASPLHVIMRFLRHEWLWLGVISAVVSLVAMLSLYGADPRFHEVWQYTPAAIPTLAFVEAVMLRTSVQVPGNHVTWFGVWVLQHMITTPKWIVIILYIGATVSSSVSAYIVFRARTIAVPLAMLGAVVFGILPARFEQSLLVHHWWVIMPIVLWWGLTWWDGASIDVREWSFWLLVSATVFLLAVSGSAMWWWASLVLLVSAIIASVTYRVWLPVWLAMGMIGLSRIVIALFDVVWPMPAMAGDAGVRLSAVWIPTADHRLTWFAQLGRDFATLDIVHTDVTYIGVFALIGLGVAVVQTLMRIIGGGSVTHVHRLLFVLGVLVVIANQRGLALAAQFVGLPTMASFSVDIWLALIGITVLLLTLQTRPVAWWLAGLMCLVIIFDHLPRTNIMAQMMQRPILVSTSSWRDGIWFGQTQQAGDVLAITGVSDIEPGYGRWSDAAIADHVEIVLAEPIYQPVTLEIRARGVGINVGAPIVVQIGDEQQTLVLTDAVAAYQLSFRRAQGDMISIYPQPVPEPPLGDSRRIGVFLQSIRLVNP